MNSFLVFCIIKTFKYLMGITIVCALIVGMFTTMWVAVPMLILAILIIAVPIIDDWHTEYTRAQASKKESKDE